MLTQEITYTGAEIGDEGFGEVGSDFPKNSEAFVVTARWIR